MHTYQLLHAVEKPMNLLYTKPFANTSDLEMMTPKLHPELAEQKKELEEERKHRENEQGAKGFGYQELELEEDPLSKLIQSAREAEGKRASKADLKEEQEKQIFNIHY